MITFGAGAQVICQEPLGQPEQINTSPVFNFNVLFIPYSCTLQGANCLGMPNSPPSCTAVTLLDPTPINGSANLTNTSVGVAIGPSYVPGSARTVLGATSDGVTEIAIQIAANEPGDQCVVTLFNDQSQQSSVIQQDGALGNNAGGSGTSNFSQNQIFATAIATANGAYAFALYQAPIDFARQNNSLQGGYMLGSCGGSPMTTDDQSACRSVSIQVRDVPTGTTISTSVDIVRPPVALIHGLWDTPERWSGFYPLYSNGQADPTKSTPRWIIRPLNYAAPIGPPFGSTPSYSSGQLLLLKSNSLGFAYNAPIVLDQLNAFIRSSALGKNAVGLPIAAVQADIVGHSMGGDISRAMVPLADFYNYTFNQGRIHKLITIDTPHAGSPLATSLLNGQNNCVQNALAWAGDISFQTVQITANPMSSFDGAVGDLQGEVNSDGSSSGLGNGYLAINSPGQHQLPTGLISGTMTQSNLNPLSNNAIAQNLYQLCGQTEQNPLALALTPSQWPSLFGPAPTPANSDGVVPTTSQLNNISSTYLQILQASGVVHSGGFESGLGFGGPSVLDAAPINQVPNTVINLLNTSVTNANFFVQLNP